MSRCFPFPPPGYEKRKITDDVDLLKKDQQSEKKHKKEKRDKEKGGSKDKREKEGKDGKHKEKKDKKEKHRDEKKHRDKEKNEGKNKNNTADEKGLPGQTEGPNAGKLIQKEIRQKDRKGVFLEEELPKRFADNNGEKAREENNHQAEENKDSIFLQELGRRIKEDGGGASNQLGQELGKNIKEEDRRAGNNLVRKFTFASHKMDEGTARLVAKDSSTWLDSKAKIEDKSIDVKKIDRQGIRVEAQPIETATIRNRAGHFHSRVGETSRSLEKNFDRAVEATVQTREASKEKKDDKPGDKRKDRDKVKKGHGKDKDRDREKEKKREEKVKEQTEHKNTEQNNFKVDNKGHMSTNSFPQITKNCHEIAVGGENLKKRKDMESNGILHASDNWPCKLPRSSSSPHPFPENGRTVNPCQSSIPRSSDSPVAATNFKLDNKEHKKNGIIGAQPPAGPPNKPISATMRADPVIEETSAKLPHPDSKYLSQVYSVPKMDEQPDFNDQEWLFGSHSFQEKRPMAESSEIVGTAQVWAETLHLEPDVYALPYVIPY
ncbi:hypothetical protein QN277_027510 [Acacia crassicarpa]|uniref:Myb-like protein X n=1 Tax=Acacia crassicarpa TaxID=499986 RepID=A0AAE1MM23_9FABA|nr:hypothetical protein QN277_027510 [Acacia crassicarpa]